jgi:hypothetical protein
MVFAVTAPPKTDTDPRVTWAVLQADPVAYDERKRTIGAEVG